MRSLLYLSLLLPTLAEARTYDLYRADRRFKGAFCSAIGGACAADSDIISGIFENAAALASGEADWDFDGDYSDKSNLEPGMKGGNDVDEDSAVLGVGYSTGRFGIGFAVSRQVTEVNANLTVYDENGVSTATSADSKATQTQFRLPVAWQVTDALSLGAGLTLTRHTVEIGVEGSNQVSTRARTRYRVGGSLGALYRLSEDWRLGSWFRFPGTIRETIYFNSTTPPIAYKEELALHSPWVWALGGEHVMGATSLLGELDVVGDTRDGFLLSYDTLAVDAQERQLRRKGRVVVLEPHAGVRQKLSRLWTLHGGTYLETSRWEDLGSRWHGTAGVSYRAWDAIDLIAGVDFAKNYSQLLLSFR